VTFDHELKLIKVEEGKTTWAIQSQYALKSQYCVTCYQWGEVSITKRRRMG